MIAMIRELLDRLPTPIKVAAWLAASAAVTRLLEALSNGTIRLDPTTLAIANVLLVFLRSRLDRMAPQLTGAESAPATP